MTKDEEKDELARTIDELEAEVLKELGATEEEYEEDNNTEGSFEMDVPSIYDIIH